MPEITDRGIAQQHEWRQRAIDSNRTKYSQFVEHVKGFLAGQNDIDLKALREGKEAEGFLTHNDEEGMVDEKMDLFKARESTMLSGRNIDQMLQTDPKLYKVYSGISGHASFLRGPHGDMSDTVPLTIRREMISAEIEQQSKFDGLYRDVHSRANKDTDPDGKMAALEKENADRFAVIYKKARPYIAADMTVAINHSEEYLKLRRRFLEVGGVGEESAKLNMLGEWSSLTARKVLTDIYTDEYAKELQRYATDETLEPDLQKRNELVSSGNAIDNEFSGRTK
ncbi:MAG: hypothetical protein KW804_01915 [Candidatus Doudnabacteria bacterium]|nr:hypothetical protein [Candidatus Doudnabacteria bacterium]